MNQLYAYLALAAVALVITLILVAIAVVKRPKQVQEVEDFLRDPRAGLRAVESSAEAAVKQDVAKLTKSAGSGIGSQSAAPDPGKPA